MNGFTDAQQKLSFTALATVSMNGDKLNLMVIAEGSTNLCHRQFGAYQNCNDIVIVHSPSGWMNEEIFLFYLQLLSNAANNSPCCLICDCYGSHITDQCFQKADELDIFLIVIPAGGTSLFQPLDIAIFGILCHIGSSIFEELYDNDPNIPLNKETGLFVLYSAWQRLTRHQVCAAWKRYQPESIEYLMRY